MAWIRIKHTLTEHYRILNLAEQLFNEDQASAVGIIICLWMWVSEQSAKGLCRVNCAKIGIYKGSTLADLSSYSAGEISNAIGYEGNPKELIDALVKTEWLTDKWILQSHDRIIGYANTSEQISRIRNRRMQHAPRNAIYQRDNYRCVYCGSQNNLTLDHVFPFSKGGQETLNNLVTCCRSCNSRKQDRTPEEAGFTFRADWRGFDG